MTMTPAPPRTADDALVDNSAKEEDIPLPKYMVNCASDRKLQKLWHEHPLALVRERVVSLSVAASRDRRLDLEMAAALYGFRSTSICSNLV
jgi:hypothetical protein